MIPHATLDIFDERKRATGFLFTFERCAIGRKVGFSIIASLSAILSSALIPGCPADARNKGPTPAQIEMFRNLKDAHIANIEAEKSLVAQIDKVADEVRKTIARQARKSMTLMLPVDDQSAMKLCERFATIAGQNPYLAVPRGTVKIAMAGGKEVVPPRVRMQLSTTLLPQQITILRQQPASGITDGDPGWKAEPGTITILHNGYDLVAVWGADIDGHPVKDAKANRAKIVKIRLAR